MGAGRTWPGRWIWGCTPLISRWTSPWPPRWWRSMTGTRCAAGAGDARCGPSRGRRGRAGVVRSNLVLWCVYLTVAHAIPVARCADLMAALTGTRPPDGFVRSLIGRAAASVAETIRMIRTLTTLAHVVPCDGTSIWVGPCKVKKQLPVACTRWSTWYLLGDRSLATFEAFVLPDLTRVGVSDQCQNHRRGSSAIWSTNCASNT